MQRLLNQVPINNIISFRLRESLGERLKYSGDCVVKGLLSAGVGSCSGRTTPGRVPSALSHRRLSASGLRAGGEASRLRFGKLWPWRSRYWGSASCSLRFSLRTRRLPCHSREQLHRTEAGVAVWEDAFTVESLTTLKQMSKHPGSPGYLA